VMSSASSAVTCTSVYTDSEPGRPHDPDYVPGPIYPNYIPLEDEHVFLVEEQPLPPVDSPTAESTGACYTTGARIIVWLQASISLPPEAKVERLLAMPTPPPSPPISLSQPSAGECLARCMAPPAHSSPPLVPSLLLPSSGCPTQIQTLSSKYEVGESSTARPTRGNTWVDPERKFLVDTYDRGRWSTILGYRAFAEQNMEHVTHDFYAFTRETDQGILRPRSQMQQAEMVELRETNRRHQAYIVETLHVMRDMRREMGDM
ncbi:hypothetical protein Tco_0899058, partial [Tanacetum coccineum]